MVGLVLVLKDIRTDLEIVGVYGIDDDTDGLDVIFPDTLASPEIEGNQLEVGLIIGERDPEFSTEGLRD